MASAAGAAPRGAPALLVGLLLLRAICAAGGDLPARDADGAPEEDLRYALPQDPPAPRAPARLPARAG